MLQIGAALRLLDVVATMLRVPHRLDAPAQMARMSTVAIRGVEQSRSLAHFEDGSHRPQGLRSGRLCVPMGQGDVHDWRAKNGDFSGP